jgi:LuxR family transcriptional regulator, maltose regulon positive regulatory protein
MTIHDQSQHEEARPRQLRAVGPETAAETGPSAGPAGDPILASKITAPDVPAWTVQRPRITELIARGTRWCPLTVITGPPGAGKTMALALWAAAEPGAVAWVNVDEFDNRPGVFWSYAIEALRRSGVAIPQAGAGWERADDHVLALRLAAALAANDPPVTLVLDDLHLLTTPQVLRELDFVLRNAGAGLRLAVSSRIDPLLPLHRYRVSGHLAEIRAADLAFSSAEAGQLLAQHGITLPADSLECLVQRTEGWAAGLRLAALSMDGHLDPGQFVTELATEHSTLTGYLMEEVLSAQPPQVRDVLLCTSILEEVSTDAAIEMTDDEQAAGILSAVARANAFIQPAGSGRYRYHTLFAEVLRLKLRRDYPDRVAGLHQRAARWYERNGLLIQAVRHAARAGDWPLAATMAIDDLAISQIIEPGSGQRLTDEFRDLPPGRSWTGPQPYLIAAAMALAAGRDESCAAALDAADGLLRHVPAGQEPGCQLAAAIIRLTAALRTGDLAAAAAAAASAEHRLSQIPDGMLARHPDISGRVLSGRGAVELWSGHLDEAASLLEEAVAAATAPGRPEPADCVAYLALAEAWRGRLRGAAELADRATAALAACGRGRPGHDQDPAALIARAWVHLERNELREARRCVKQADTALDRTPDALIAAAAYLVAAGGALAEGRASVAVQIITRARSGRPIPPWIDQRLSMIQSRACAAAGDIQAALAAAGRAGSDDSPEAAVTLAHARAAAGDSDAAARALAPVLAAPGVPDRVRLYAWLADARLGYDSGDRARGHRSLAAALRLAEPEQLRLPFVLERGWITPVLRQDLALAGAHRRLFSALDSAQPAPAIGPDQAPPLPAEPLSDREREVLRHISEMLSTAEVASEMYISVNTVKTHLRAIYRKLAAAHRGEAVRRARQLELI